ncbi:MAG: hypothetical protein ACE5KA_07765 [Nitrososphaerales archaeon]
MKEAGIKNPDEIIEKAARLREVAKRYYLDISGKEKELGISRTILYAPTSLIFHPTDRQKNLLKYLLKSEETTRQFLIEKFGTTIYASDVKALHALKMVEIKTYKVFDKMKSGYEKAKYVSVVKPYHDRIIKFWSYLSLELQT